VTPREQITALLDGLGTVGGLTVTAYAAQPDTPHPGAAWPALRSIARDGTLTAPFARAYDVFVVLPGTYASSAADTAEAVIEHLVDALEEVGEWTQPADVIQLRTSSNADTVPAIRVRITPDTDQ